MHGTLLNLVLRHYHPKTTLVAMVIRGGSVLSIGKNQYKGKGNYGVHAEVHALKQVKNAVGATLWVIRIRKNKTLGCSKPCPDCMDTIIKAGVKKIHYIDERGIWQTQKVRKEST